MINNDRELVRRFELFLDVILTVQTFIFAYFMKRSLLPGPFGGLTTAPNYYLVLLLITIIWYITLDFKNYKFRYGTWLTGHSVIELFKGVTISTIILVVCLYIFKISDFSRLLIVIFFVMDVIVLSLARLMINQLISSRKINDYSSRYVLILGSLTTAQELIRLINKQEKSDIKIVGCIEINREDVGKSVSCGVKVVGALDDLRDILLNRVIDEVLITMPLNGIKNSDWYLSFINAFGITIRIIPYWYLRNFMTKYASHGVVFEQFLSEPALIINRVPVNQDTMVIKSIMEYLLAIFVLTVTSPLFVIIPILIKLFSPGPVFYKQVRCGQYGRKFQLFKFRSMVSGAEEQQYSLLGLNEVDGPVFKIKKDPRIIPYIGTFLRKFGLDELPQFINVIRGEMSVVGPRPPTPSEVEKYELWQRRRLSLKPGITCIWQIQPKRNEITFEKWMDMDMEYIDRWSLWLDMVLILKTIPAILSGYGR